MNPRVGILLVALPAMLAAQAMVENAMGVGRAATSTAPAQKAGQVIGAAFGSLGRTLESPEAKASAAKSRVVKPAAGQPAARSLRSVPARPQKATVAPSASLFPNPEPPEFAPESKAAVTFEDPSGIEKGMEYADVVRRFGPPSLKLTTGPAEEILSFAKKNAIVGVTVHNGKVTAVQKAGG